MIIARLVITLHTYKLAQIFQAPTILLEIPATLDWIVG